MSNGAGEIDYPRLLFTETQRVRQPWLWAIAVVVAVVPAGMIIYARLQNPRLHPVFVLGVLAVCTTMPVMLWVMGLRVAVTSDLLRINFVPFPGKKISTADIVSAVAETYHPIKEFGGWGMKWSLYGSTVVYSIGGNRGVRVELRSGMKIMIGSNRADELAAAITSAMGTQSEPALSIQ